MKNRGIVFLMVSFLCAASAVTEAADISSSSRISEVTVYSSGAFVTRTAAVEVKPGDARILIPDIIANFDSESLRVKGRGTAEVKILGAQVKTDFLEDTPVEKVRELEGRIRALEDQNRVLENEKRVLNDEKAYLDSVRLFAGQKIPEDLVTKMPSAQDLEATLSFLGSKLRENFNRGMTIDLEIRENGRKIDALRRELETISGNRQKVRYTAVVDIEVAKAGKLDVEVSYKVWDASWTPVYDARAKFDDSETEFIT